VQHANTDQNVLRLRSWKFVWCTLLTDILNMWDSKQHVMSSPAKLGMLHSTVVIFFANGPGRLLNLSFYWMWNWKRPNFHFWYILAVSKSVCVCTPLNTTVSGRDGKKTECHLDGCICYKEEPVVTVADVWRNKKKT